MRPGVKVGEGVGDGVGEGAGVGAVLIVGDGARVPVATGAHAVATNSATRSVLIELP
jgi:hypothetical protein